MICVFFIFCSSVVQGSVPVYQGAVSQFDVPALVFLAHNLGDGMYFDDIQVGNVIHYYDGEWVGYRVRELRAMQATEPDSLTTNLVWNGETLTPYQIHQQIFHSPNTLVLMTCIARDGDIRWGRLFVIADLIK